MKTKALAIALCVGLTGSSAVAQQTLSPSTPVPLPRDEGGALIGQLGPVTVPALIALLALYAVGPGGGS